MPFTGVGRVAGSAGDPRPDDVVLAVDGALWATGGAAGVGDGRRCVGIDVHSGLGVSGGEQVGPGTLTGNRIDGQRVVVSEVAGTVRGGQGQRRPGIFDHPASLRGCQVGVDPDPDGAESLSGEEGFDEGGPVRQAGGHPVTGPDAEPGEPAGRCGDALIQFPVCQPVGAVDECLPVRMSAHAVDEDVGEGVGPLRQRRRVGTDLQTPIVEGRLVVVVVVRAWLVGHGRKDICGWTCLLGGNRR